MPALPRLPSGSPTSFPLSAFRFLLSAFSFPLSVFSFSASLALLFLPHSRAGGAPPEGAALLKTDVLGVFAHPDDETGVAPLLADLALRQGRTVSHVYCTRGEGGGNMVGTQYGPGLGILREAELRDCLAQLGVRFAYFLDREDFAYTESRSVTLERWGHEESLRRLVRLVRALRPEVVVTMNPAPTPGQHGNHQAAGWLAVEAFDAAGDPRRFPEQLDHEGLSAWQPRKLYFGGVGPHMATLATTNALPDGRIPAQVAATALSNHRSQAFGNFGNSPWFLRPQRLQLVQSVVPWVAEETDLFRGLPLAEGTVPARTFPVADLAASRPVAPLFRPRPAVAQYQSFVRAHRIEHAASSFVPDIPVVAGTRNEVFLHIPPGARSGDVQVRWPAGWRGAAAPRRLRPGNLAFYDVEVPTEATGDLEVQATVSTLPGAPSTARLHVVPRAVVPRGRPGPVGRPKTATVGWPAPGATLSIPHTRVWEGRVRDAADSSATVRVAQDGRNLYLEMAVRDDVVVRNIQPNDIKGHWRSDSVEICIDPHPGSEHALGCYKLGVFPFDATGRVRGARDADARPGPLEETAPGTVLTSWRTADGYVVRAAIPLAEAGVRPGRGVEVGFNVLVYDGDKAGAAPGENINKSRLAWSPRGGVQGRPEDWGRLRLE